MAYPTARSGDGRDMHPSPEAKTLARIRAHERERLIARAIISEIMLFGLTPELRERSRLFLEASSEATGVDEPRRPAIAARGPKADR